MTVLGTLSVRLSLKVDATLNHIWIRPNSVALDATTPQTKNPASSTTATKNIHVLTSSLPFHMHLHHRTLTSHYNATYVSKISNTRPVSPDTKNLI
jgi:hypothetical protein